MKKTLLKTSLIVSSVLAAIVLTSCGNKASKEVTLIEDIPTIQAFKADAIPDADLAKIINAGVNAQSAINLQPWHFSVVSNQDVLKDINEKMKSGRPKPPAGADKDEMKAPPAPPAGAKGPKAAMGDSPIAIIVSAKDGSEFDAGLAAELMTVEAVLLGYGTKIISSPTIALNGPNQAEYKQILGIPEDMSAKAVILVGKIDDSVGDAVTAASIRKPSAEVVTYVK